MYFYFDTVGDMDKKNTPNDTSISPKKTHFDITKLAADMLLITTLLTSTPSFSQTEQKNFADDKKKANIALIEQNDSIYHQNIITKKIQDIFAEYGEEQ